MTKKYFDLLDLVKIILLLIALFLFWKKGIVTLDPDFGWHWRMGQIITSSGVPKTDPFSYTMPSFLFVDHEWLTNIIFYKLFNLFGNSFLALLYSLFGVLSLMVVIGGLKSDQNSIFKVSLLTLAIGAILPFFGVRPQVISWLFLAVWLKVILNENIFKKYFYLLPFLMLFWANLHGSFALGIFCLGLVLGLRFLRTRKVLWQELFCFILCLAATFINPYGFRLWGEVWQQVSDSALRWRIAEWSPSFFVPILPYLFFVSFGFLLYRFRHKLSWEKIVLYLFFLMQSLLGLRYIPLFVIVSLPIYLEALEYLYENVSGIKYGKQRWQKAGIFMVLLSFLTVGSQVFFTIKESRALSEGTFYPLSAIAYLQQNSPKGNLFSSYNWGGYLIWKLPEKKVFIDGRMPSWRWKAKKANESNNAMEDYLKMQETEEGFEKELVKYNITTILWTAKKEEKIQPKSIEGYLQRIFHLKENFSLVNFLKKEGWREVYKDSLAVIYTRE